MLKMHVKLAQLEWSQTLPKMHVKLVVMRFLTVQPWLVDGSTGLGDRCCCRMLGYRRRRKNWELLRCMETQIFISEDGERIKRCKCGSLIQTLIMIVKFIVVLSVKLSVSPQELVSVRYSCPADAPTTTLNLPRKPLEEQSSSSQADRRSSFQESSVSPTSWRLISTDSRKIIKSSQTVLVLSWSESMDHLRDFLSSIENRLEFNNRPLLIFVTL